MSAEEFPCPGVVRVYLRQKHVMDVFLGSSEVVDIWRAEPIPGNPVSVQKNRHLPTN